jgi:hypothetical protein
MSHASIIPLPKMGSLSRIDGVGSSNLQKRILRTWELKLDIVDRCACGTEYVEIEAAVLKRLVEITKPNMKPVKKTARQGWLRVCPRCNAYGLGVDLIETYPLHTQHGEVTDIKALVNAPGFWETQ